MSDSGYLLDASFSLSDEGGSKNYKTNKNENVFYLISKT